jgi:hypothetical protein
MNRAQLKELLRKAIYEVGATKRRNKEFKRWAVKQAGGVAHDRLRHGRDKMRPEPGRSKTEKRAWQQDPDAYWRSKGIDPKRTRSGFSKPLPVPDASSPVTPGPKDAKVKIPSNSPAPPDVMAAINQGGKIIIGRYYDAQGNYLGKSQGGQWVPNKQTYAPDDTQLRELGLYNKIKEIESNGYKVKDKEMVKEMIREALKSCK